MLLLLLLWVLLMLRLVCLRRLVEWMLWVSQWVVVGVVGAYGCHVWLSSMAAEVEMETYEVRCN